MRLHSIFVTVAALIIVAPAGQAQQTEQAAVIATVQKMFDAMRTRDTVLLNQAFDSTGRIVGVSTRNGPPTITLTTPSQFGAALTRAPAGDVWYERMYDPEVRIDGGVAQVWAYYTFHRNSTFSHCGIDAFMLAKVGDTWKITQVADTRRTTMCPHATIE